MICTAALTLRYTQGPALQFPDMTVAQGGVVLLRGASGSGKSTWLALAAGLLVPTSGTITVAGQPLAVLTRSALDVWRARTIGFLPQKLHLSAALTVQDNLVMAQWAAGQPQRKAPIADVLATLGLQDLASRKPSQLSGGQAQRVALARAVLLEPRVLMADEPTASLDDAAAALGLLHAACGRLQATLVIATHDSRVQAFFNAKHAENLINMTQINL